MHPADPRRPRVARLTAGVTVALAALLTVSLSAGSAAASQGSVPGEVTRYAEAADGLIAQLDDLFGVAASGQGIAFGDTTTVGAINRAWVFTAGYLAGDDPETAVELANLWSAPILIDEQPVGLATIWINPATDAPDLADFVVSASAASALSAVPDDAQLVFDAGRGAWFSLVVGKLVALIPGTSGVVGSTTLGAYQEIAASGPPAVPQDMSGLIAGVLAAGVAGLGVIGILLIPMLAARLRASAEVKPVPVNAVTRPPKKRTPKKRTPKKS